MARRGNTAPSAAPVEAAAPAAHVPQTFGSVDVLRKGNNVKEMAGAELKAYARLLGVRPSDIDNLTEDRLRVNCMLTIDTRHAQLMED